MKSKTYWKLKLLICYLRFVRTLNNDNGFDKSPLKKKYKEFQNVEIQTALLQYRRFSKWDNTAHSPPRRSRSSEKSRSRHRGSRSRSRSKSRQSPTQSTAAANLEDSAYVSSPDSNCSRRRLITTTQPNSRPNSCNSSDESTSGCNGANSESGAESVETDSVFFGNFRACAERERLRQSHQGVMEQLQQRPINYQAFQVKSRVYWG